MIIDVLVSCWDWLSFLTLSKASQQAKQGRDHLLHKLFSDFFFLVNVQTIGRDYSGISMCMPVYSAFLFVCLFVCLFVTGTHHVALVVLELPL